MKKFTFKNYVGVFSFIMPHYVYAKTSDLSGIAEHITKQLDTLSILLVVVAYVMGIAFSLIGITQFKAHKDQPQQIPLSKPIVYIVIAACLLFLPTAMKISGESIFGNSSNNKQVGSMDFRAVDIE